MTFFQERRKHPRKTLAVYLELYDHNTKTPLGKGFVTNLSEGGLALETRYKINPGEKFLFRFTLPNGWNFDVVGEVVHCSPGILTNAYGVKFLELSPDAQKKLKKYILAEVTDDQDN